MNWASSLDERAGRFRRRSRPGQPTYPGNQGGTNWYPPSFSPRTGLFYFAAWDNYAYGLSQRRSRVPAGPQSSPAAATPRLTDRAGAPAVGIGRRGPINNWTDAVGHGALMAIDPQTGAVKWKFEQYDVSDSGMLTTASDLLFTGGREGHVHALDARSGKQLWRASLGGQIVMAPVTYQVDGRQYVSVISGNALATFGLRR